MNVLLGGGESARPCYIATVTNGFEYITEEELSSKLPLSGPPNAHRSKAPKPPEPTPEAAEEESTERKSSKKRRKTVKTDADDQVGEGRVLFTVKETVSLESLCRQMSQLCSVEYIAAAVGVFSGLPGDATCLDLLRPSKLPGGLGPWQKALESWTVWRKLEHEPLRLSKETSAVPKFRISAKRGGKHSFSSNDMAQALAGAVEAELGWVPELTEYDIEVCCHLRFSTLSIGAMPSGFELGPYFWAGVRGWRDCVCLCDEL